MKINLKSILLITFFISSNSHSLHLAVNCKLAITLAQKQVALAIVVKILAQASDDEIFMAIKAFQEVGQIKELAEYIIPRNIKMYTKIYDVLRKNSIIELIELIEAAKNLIKVGKNDEAKIHIEAIHHFVDLNRRSGIDLYETYLLHFCFDTDPKIQVYCKGGLAAL